MKFKSIPDDFRIVAKLKLVYASRFCLPKMKMFDEHQVMMNDELPGMELRNRKNRTFIQFPEWIMSRSTSEQIEEKLQSTYFSARNHLKQKDIKSAGVKAAVFSIMVIVVMILFAFVSSIFDSKALPARQSIRTDWHDKVSSLRDNEVINPRYDDLYISILVGSGEFKMDKEVHASIGTFLRQVKYLQVSNSKLSNTFVGGEPMEVLPFFKEVPELPQLERYIDSYKTMIESQPNLSWYIQIDDGSIY